MSIFRRRPVLGRSAAKCWESLCDPDQALLLEKRLLDYSDWTEASTLVSVCKICHERLHSRRFVRQN
jgi:hypothetical protein